MALYKRILSGILCFLVMIGINFLLPRLMPGDPVLMLTGRNDDAVSASQYAMYYEKLGLADSMGTQFWRYIQGLFKGDLGYSYRLGKPVAEVLAARIPITLQLALPSVVLSSGLALVLGLWTGWRKERLADRIVTPALVVLNAVPAFLLAMLIVTVFAFNLRWFPLGGLNSIVAPQGRFAALGDRIRHLVLPVATVTFSGLPAKYLLLRNMTASAADEKYTLYARARGLSAGRVVFIHIFRNICPPFITLVGLNLGFMIAGSMMVEVIFSINGMGGLIYEAAAARDFPTLQGALLVVSFIVILANLLSDILCQWVDPKQRHGVGEHG